MRMLLIDNYDSFTYNLVQRLGEIDGTLDGDLTAWFQSGTINGAAIVPTQQVWNVDNSAVDIDLGEVDDDLQVTVSHQVMDFLA